MFILVLGSYDPQTKSLLHRLQESIANEFSKEGHYGLLMESLELYVGEDQYFEIRPVLIEKSENSSTFYVFSPTFMMNPNNLDAIDTVPLSDDPQCELRKYLIDNGFISSSASINPRPMLARGNYEPTSGPFLFPGIYLKHLFGNTTKGTNSRWRVH